MSADHVTVKKNVLMQLNTITLTGNLLFHVKQSHVGLKQLIQETLCRIRITMCMQRGAIILLTHSFKEII